MSVISQAVRGASWLALFKFISQGFSWATTILITRMLTSQDYGLMEIATIFTGFVGLFVEFGIGSALINKEKIDDKELSTAFWFSLFWGIILSLFCFVLAPITANYYSEQRVYHLTQGASLLFILGSLAIVPRSILQRELRFKQIAIIEFITVILSCAVMLVLAWQKAGAWTLLGGFLSREASRLFLLFCISKFVPKLIFSRTLLGPIIRFGTPVMLSSSLFYIYNKADRFFGGMVYNANDLGYYVLALQLAAIPVEKIVSLLQSVLFPTLSRFKNDLKSFRGIYLDFIAIIAILTMPLFTVGYLLSMELVVVLLGEKWRLAVSPLRILFIAQLFISITAPNSLVHAARGKPFINLVFNIILTICLVIGFYYSSKLKELSLLASPWITIFPVLQIAYVSYTNNEMDISSRQYLHNLMHPFIGTSIMTASLLILNFCWGASTESLSYILTSIMIAGLTYFIYFYLTARPLLQRLIALKDI